MSALAKRRRSAVRCFTGDYIHDHRGDFQTCPHCGVKFGSEEWPAWTHTLVLEIVGGKHGALVTIAECPKCFEDSWIHEWFDSICLRSYDEYPKTWRAAAERERGARHARAKEEWAAGICKNCRRRDSFTVETAAYRHCYIGSGGPETECDRFAKLEEKP